MSFDKKQLHTYCTFLRAWPPNGCQKTGKPVGLFGSRVNLWRNVRFLDRERSM